MQLQPNETNDVCKVVHDDFKSIAWLIVGHGTRSPAGVRQFENLVKEIQSLAPTTIIRGCFLELALPSIPQAMQSLFEAGITRIIVVPVLLFSAAHAQSDIPEAVGAAAGPLGMHIVRQTPPLGTMPPLVALSQRRFREMRALEQTGPCPPFACAWANCSAGECRAAGQPQGRVGLAMVGRGTSDERALDHMRQLTKIRATKDAITHFQTGFFAGGVPNVDALLEEASNWPCDTIIVQPHLLFEGELTSQLREKIRVLNEGSTRQWLLARTLGVDVELARVFVHLAIAQPACLPQAEES
jgi:sirohydrochlorin cobaltochelatase